MFEDVSGFGAWHRRWSALQGNKLCFWKYPDEETRKEPMGIIDLKRCVTEKVGLIPRDICARPNTFELVTVRQPRRGEEDTLVSKTYNTMTSIRFKMTDPVKSGQEN
uniref:Actin-binding protein anillin n=1 Tax=Magallana gigas TaxID=29159 RepID=K1PFR3_MAGGI